MPAVNGVGEPCAGEPHARFEVAGTGNGADLAKVTGVAQPTGKPAATKAPGPKASEPPRQSPTLHPVVMRLAFLGRGLLWRVAGGRAAAGLAEDPPGLELVLSAALSAHGSAAVFVDGAATLGVAEPGNRCCWGWSSPLSSDWRGKETGRGSGLEPPATARRGQGGRDRPRCPGLEASGTLMRIAINAPPHMAFANRHGPRSGEAG